MCVWRSVRWRAAAHGAGDAACIYVYIRGRYASVVRASEIGPRAVVARAFRSECPTFTLRRRGGGALPSTVAMCRMGCEIGWPEARSVAGGWLTCECGGSPAEVAACSHDVNLEPARGRAQPPCEPGGHGQGRTTHPGCPTPTASLDEAVSAAILLVRASAPLHALSEES